MNNRTLLTGLLGVSTAASAAAQTPAKVKAPQTRPNIIIIYTDDMGIGDLSCTNTGWIETPAIDRLASQGLVMNNYYSAAPVSSPSRVGLTTGMFPMEWGINTYLQARKGNAACEQADYLSADAPSMARILHDAGYATGHFGKWHMGGGRDVTDAPQITRYGFDEYCSTWESPDPAPELTASNWIWCKKDDVKRWERTGYFIDKTLDFLVRHQGTPCFVNLWPDDMHTPWVPDEESQDHNNTWGSRPNFTEVLAEYDPETRGGNTPDGRRIKGTIHWVDAETAVDAEVRLYDTLFTEPNPEAGEGDFLELVNPASLEILTGCKAETSLADAQAPCAFQFLRLGYFCVDSRDSSAEHLVFNRAVSLKDGFKNGK